MIIPLAAVSTLIYLMATGSWTWWDVGIGLGLTCLALLRFPSYLLPERSSALRRDPVGSTWGLLRLTGVIFGLVLSGTFALLRAAAGGGRQPGFIEVPLEADSDASLGLAMFLFTVSPDGFVVHADRERRVLVMHVLDVRRAEQIRQRQHDQFNRYVKPLFERG